MATVKGGRKRDRSKLDSRRADYDGMRGDPVKNGKRVVVSGAKTHEYHRPGSNK